MLVDPSRPADVDGPREVTERADLRVRFDDDRPFAAVDHQVIPERYPVGDEKPVARLGVFAVLDPPSERIADSAHVLGDDLVWPAERFDRVGGRRELPNQPFDQWFDRATSGEGVAGEASRGIGGGDRAFLIEQQGWLGGIREPLEPPEIRNRWYYSGVH